MFCFLLLFGPLTHTHTHTHVHADTDQDVVVSEGLRQYVNIPNTPKMYA